jgi:hypothetical protein
VEVRAEASAGVRMEEKTRPARPWPPAGPLHIIPDDGHEKVPPTISDRGAGMRVFSV